MPHPLCVRLVDEHLFRERQRFIETQGLLGDAVQGEGVLSHELLSLLASKACFLLIGRAVCDIKQLAHAVLNPLQLVLLAESHLPTPLLGSDS